MARVRREAHGGVMRRTRWLPARRSLLGQFLLWLLLPLVVLWAVNVALDYRSGREAANIAYDRTLLASARIIADQLEVHDGKVAVTVPYVALDTFEYDNRGRLYYRVSGLSGEYLSGYDDLPDMPAGTPRSDLYPALVHFHDAVYRAQPIRVATLFQPVNEGGLQGMVKIQVAETLEAREAIAGMVLRQTLWGQGLLVFSAVGFVALALVNMLRPLRRLSREVAAREPADLSPLPLDEVHREIVPLVAAINQHTGRLEQLLARQQRFAADASHQLRTPLAVLTTQAEHALRENDPALLRECLEDMRRTLGHTTRLTNQLLLLARLDAASDPAGTARHDDPVALTRLAERVCVARLKEARGKGLDLGLEREPPDLDAILPGNEVLLEELLANLVDNAIRHTPEGGTVTLRLRQETRPGSRRTRLVLEVEDSGPGIPAAQRQVVFERFHQLPDAAPGGSGLGLAIVRDICRAHRAGIELAGSPHLSGLLVRISFPWRKPVRPA
ncbi:sensor histidine kinase [Pseudogulbenkiania ferrooxidans]|uniref:histidine kinase n=1 Tax=Pseudogulbenkiania ferrooxidans 2002 TaxID=279714 RepID=B9YZ40_9NEIS|nr:sensor histidine kinase [Pseudogulbenkiania ferrooxidans]EEG10393.1 integral membrane sensor signal transduction histidine kinase [Pseudogulbenkiania ferrooxidans 2002]